MIEKHRFPSGYAGVAAIALTRPMIIRSRMATCAAIVSEPLVTNAGEDSYNILPAIFNHKNQKPIRKAVIAQSSRGYFAIQKGDWKLINGLGSGGFSHPAIIEQKER